MRLSVVYMYAIICLLGTEANICHLFICAFSENLSQEKLNIKVSMEGTNTSVKEKTNISSQGVFLALMDFICCKAKHSSYWRKTVFLISTDFICCEVKNSGLQGGKNHAFEMVPFLETKKFHIYFAGPATRLL